MWFFLQFIISFKGIQCYYLPEASENLATTLSQSGHMQSMECLQNMILPFYPPVLCTCSFDVLVWKPKNLLGSQTTLKSSYLSNLFCLLYSVLSIDALLSIIFLKGNGKGKSVPLLNYAPWHEGMWWSRGTAPLVFNLSTRYGSHSACKPSHFTLVRLDLYPSDRRLRGS